MRLKLVYIVGFAGFLSACTGAGGDWPKLTDPLPDPTARERVSVTSEPELAEESVIPTITTISAEEAQQILGAAEETLAALQAEYQQTLKAIAGKEGEAWQDAWHTAQLALTRLSQETAVLDPIANSTIEAFTEIAERASSLRRNIDSYVIAERQRLTQMQP